ncbi:MAG: hypothetical protein GY716_15750 [bacterium]|nr:hypothetical protein [bacterium]
MKYSEWTGGGLQFTITSELKMSSLMRFYNVQANAASQDVKLPDARKLRTGGWVFFVNNRGATHAFDLVDQAGTTLATVDVGKLVTIELLTNADVNGTWNVVLRDSVNIPEPPSNDFLHTISGVDVAIQKEIWKYDHGLDSWAERTAPSNHHIEGAGERASLFAYVFCSGSGGGQNGDETDEYSGALDSWTAKTDCTTGSQKRTSGVVSNLIEAYGKDSGTPRNQHEQYARSGDSWTSGTVFPSNIRHAFGASPGNSKIYIYGGIESTTAIWTAVLSNREHEPVGDTFSSKTALPTDTRAEHGGFVLGSKCYSVAGRTKKNSGVDLDRTDEYDPVGDSWTTRQAWPHGGTRNGPGCTTIGTTAYGTGGEGNIQTASYQVDTWTSSLANHGAGGSSLSGFQNETLPLPIP